MLPWICLWGGRRSARRSRGPQFDLGLTKDGAHSGDCRLRRSTLSEMEERGRAESFDVDGSQLRTPVARCAHAGVPPRAGLPGHTRPLIEGYSMASRGVEAACRWPNRGICMRILHGFVGEAGLVFGQASISDCSLAGVQLLPRGSGRCDAGKKQALEGKSQNSPTRLPGKNTPCGTSRLPLNLPTSPTTSSHPCN